MENYFHGKHTSPLSSEDSEQLVKNQHARLMTLDEARKYLEIVFSNKPIYQGDHWAAVKSITGLIDWIQIGSITVHFVGKSHLQHYGPPSWDIENDDNHWHYVYLGIKDDGLLECFKERRAMNEFNLKTVNSENFSDVTLFASSYEEKITFFGHKILLTQRSEFFKKLFLSGFMDSESKMIEIWFPENFTNRTEKNILKFVFGLLEILYAGVFGIETEMSLNEDDVILFIELFNYYQIPIDLCLREIIQSKVKIENLCKVYTILPECKTQKIVLEMISHNIGAISKNELSLLDKESLIELVKK
jgi:hypothetical protein